VIAAAMHEALCNNVAPADTIGIVARIR